MTVKWLDGIPPFPFYLQAILLTEEAQRIMDFSPFVEWHPKNHRNAQLFRLFAGKNTIQRIADE